MTYEFSFLQHAVGHMSYRERTVAAHVLHSSAQPLLRALANELTAANAIEDAAVAALDQQYTSQHITELAEMSATLPAPGERTDKEGN